MREPSALLTLILILVSGITLLFLFQPRPEPDDARPKIQAVDEMDDRDGSATITDDKILNAETDVDRQSLLSTEAQITGRLVDADGPMVGVKIELLHTDRKRVVHSTWRGTSDSEGYFFASGIRSGRFWPIAHGPTVPPGLEFRAFELQDDQPIDLGELRVPDACALHGRVTDAEGMPMEGVRVYQIYSSRHFYRRFNLDAFPDSEEADDNVLTDAQGRFAFDHLLPGKHRILAEAEQYIAGTTECVLAKGSNLTLPDLKLQLGWRVQGRVFSTDGNPIENALVASLTPFGRPASRRGTHTTADGRFLLQGLNSGANLRAKAIGYAIQDGQPESLSDRIESIRFELQPELTLRGHVHGLQAAGGTLQIDPENLDTLSPSVQKLCWVPLPIEGDGSFVIEGLVQDRYEITAFDGAGHSRKSEPLRFDLLPDMAPLTLTIVDQQEIEIVVRDDLGRVLADAEVFTHPRRHYRSQKHSWPTGSHGINDTIKHSQQEDDGGQHLRTDTEGRAFPRHPAQSLSIAASHAGHLPAAVSFRPGEVPNHVELILPRAAHLSGRIIDSLERDRFAMSIRATPLPGQGEELPKTATSFTSIDARGRYAFASLRPGRYEIAVTYGDESRDGVDPTRPKTAIPLLGGGSDPRTTRRVDLEPLQPVKIDLKTAPHGVISGQVRLHGTPTAGVIVFAALPNEEDPDSPVGSQDLDSKDAFERRPHTTTDVDGRFKFVYVNPGDWHLLAQHPDASMPGNPVAIHAPDFALQLEQDLILEAAEVRGQIDMMRLRELQHTDVEVFLLRIDLARDPFSSFRSKGRDVNIEKIAEDGSFAFSYLREGHWILRFTRKWGGILMQIPVQTVRDRIVDVGILTPRETVTDATVAVDLPDTSKHAFALLRRIYDGIQNPVYRGMSSIDKGMIALLGIEPGTYQAELYWAYPLMLHPPSPNGESADAFATFEVHADGRVTPSELVFK